MDIRKRWQLRIRNAEAFQRNIPEWIYHEVDFIWVDKEIINLPRHIRTEALKAIEYRKANWVQMVQDEKAKYE